MPNQERIKQWIEALRSGKYTQTIGRLRSGNEDGFCCLGVACDLSGLGKWEWSLTGDRCSYRTHDLDESTTYLPSPVAEYYGLAQSIQSVLGQKNDNDNLSFNEIADYIEEVFIK